MDPNGSLVILFNFIHPVNKKIGWTEENNKSGYVFLQDLQ